MRTIAYRVARVATLHGERHEFDVYERSPLWGVAIRPEVGDIIDYGGFRYEVIEVQP